MLKSNFSIRQIYENPYFTIIFQTWFIFPGAISNKASIYVRSTILLNEASVPNTNFIHYNHSCYSRSVSSLTVCIDYSKSVNSVNIHLNSQCMNIVMNWLLCLLSTKRK